MNYNERTKRGARPLPPKRTNSFQPLSAPVEGEDDELMGRPSRPSVDRGWQPATEPLPALKLPPSAMPRRGPTHPAWERPPTPYAFPQLRGQEQHRTMLPILLATLGVAVVLVALVIIPALFGHAGGAAAASASASGVHASSPVASGSPNSSASIVASPDNSGAPQPIWTYTQYQVVTGDSVSKIAKKFGIQQWELLLANPQIVNGIVKLGSNLNIPPAGVLTPAPATPAAS